ncbi:MAG: serine/threonine protein kinase [Planctomycetes bacterium]|nr:serine/threonine protein kinase [Planctomycetota bacterium]
MHPPRVGPYLIDRKIGAGGMGTVYVGTHEQTGQVAAIKVLPASMSREDGFVLRFNREIEALQRLNHANIVKFFESGTEDDETYYYAMEYIEGETLTIRLRRDRRISWQETIQLGIQICAGLKHAHDVGVVHRDLKPSNLLISKEGVVKITDFGVAQVFAAQQLTITGAIIGTAEYMSPEQVEGRRADRRSDLYSMGAVLYTMLVGQPPFANGTVAEIMQKQRYGRFDPPRSYVPEVPSWLDAIVCQLLEKNPEKRIPDAYVASRRLQGVARKVELKNSVEGPLADNETRLDGPLAGGRLGATLVRDLMRAQSANDEPNSAVERMMNNVWVLITLLVLVLGGLVWFWPTGTSDSIGVGPDSEPERILLMARRRWKNGDAAGAKRELEALRTVIAGDEAFAARVKEVDKLLSTIRSQRPTFPQAFMSDAIRRAAAVRRTDPVQARSILQGLLTLYENDGSLSKQIREVQAMLDSLPGAIVTGSTPPDSATPVEAGAVDASSPTNSVRDPSNQDLK